MAKASLTLVLPGYASLLVNPLNHSAQPASLNKLTSKSRFIASENSLEKCLFQCFYPELKQASDLPMAALLAGKQAQLCVAPCYVHADQGRLLLFQRDIKLTNDETEHLVQALQPFFVEKQAQLLPSEHVISSVVEKSSEHKHWLLQCTQAPRIECSAITELEGQSVLEHLPTGEDAADWITLWNEIQMLLFDLPLNQQREAAGKLPVNSVWFWGRLDLPDTAQSWKQVAGNHPLLSALAEQTGSTYLKTDISLPKLTGDSLMLLPGLDWQQDWQAQLEKVEQTVFKPLWQALRKGHLARLNIVIPEWGRYSITPWQSWKFWS